ncbi:uncharacterized protein FTJAE_1668 [Fusarium tjaetaba]|uniref:BTB domain-containing protein n=1 Tax=Fusarium tjaetaba TaxID=1567544 RepID=A0A8H5W3F8_9HYPO|nr:uncharacterized protein FTJAE_1668 [Fusarium tjaetaba]KAF5647612.1 hypothetical protein FTJAE_1668 [Fusarium tjaetaba]
MAVFTHDIVPDGDLYAVLKKANTARTIPSVTVHCSNHAPPEASLDSTDVNLPETSSGLELLSVKEMDTLEYRFRVSSRHLTLASPFFRTMLNGSWKESAPAGATLVEATPTDKTPSKVEAFTETSEEVPKVSALREISTEGWNVHAFLTVLRIIHGFNYLVPEAVSLSFFTDVAVIVDYYECAEAVAPFAKLWEPPFRSSGRVLLQGRTPIMWLWITWVFSWESEFSRRCYIWARSSQGMDLVDTHDLPVAELLKKLEKKRQWSFDLFTAKLVSLRANLREDLVRCNSKCTCMLLGALDAAEDRMQKKFGISGPPYSGVPMMEIDTFWEDIDSPDCRDSSESKRGHPRCSLDLLIRPTFDHIVEAFGRIKITDFQAKRRKGTRKDELRSEVLVKRKPEYESWDLVVVLKEPNSANLTLDVSIRESGTVLRKNGYQNDKDVLNLPKVKSILPAVEGSGSDKEPVEVHFRVSSQHMKLASPNFERMLNGPWSESTSTPPSRAGLGSLGPCTEIYDDAYERFPPRSATCTSSSPLSTREVNAHGWSPEALLLVLKVIHGMNDEFPLVTSIEFLVEVLAGEVWHQTMYRFPLAYGKRCVLWLFIAWAFGWKDDFSKLASFVIEHGEGLKLIKSNEHSVNVILGTLDNKRQECIAKIITRLNELTDELLDGRAGCGHRCSSMLLGSLLWERKSLPLLDPALQSPYTGYSVYEYSKKISAFRVMDWGYMGCGQSTTAHRCTIIALMEPLLKAIDDDIKNFEISKAG